jgi:hypothetical protein
MPAVYRVQVGRHPSCTCPDAAKGNVCKHYLYCMLRVLRLRQDDPLVWQKALLSSEAEEVGIEGLRHPLQLSSQERACMHACMLGWLVRPAAHRSFSRTRMSVRLDRPSTFKAQHVHAHFMGHAITRHAQVLSGARSTRSEEGVMANSAVCAAYRRMSGAGDDAAQGPVPETGRPVEGDCPVCYDGMQPGGASPQVATPTVHTPAARMSPKTCLVMDARMSRGTARLPQALSLYPPLSGDAVCMGLSGAGGWGGIAQEETWV